jgi:hypothetical protein
MRSAPKSTTGNRCSFLNAALAAPSTALALFGQVFRAAELRFVFNLRALRLEDDWLTFYIKPEDGLELPAIMKWL